MKACLYCSLLCEKDDICLGCGRNEFTEEWSGILLINNDMETSKLSKLSNKTKKGIYAIKLTT